MILGIGNDLADVRRFEASIAKLGDRLARRVLTESEWQQYRSSLRPAVFLTKRFAVKEAVAKALGTGFRQGVSWQDISIHHSDLGQPTVTLSGAAQRRFESLGGRALHVTLSDEGHLVSAFAVVSD
jgi:holo-[acyl-carrier protein] synthase